MLRPGRLLAPLGSPVLRRRGLYPRSFHRDGHPIPMSDSLRGCQAATTAGPSPAGLRRFRAARYYRHHCSYGPMRQSRVHQRISRLAVISPASRTRDLPCVASQALRPCRRPYTGELLRGIRPTLPRGFRLSPRRMSSALSCPATAFARESFSALQRFLYVAAWSLARPSGQPRLATARALSSELSSSGRPFSTSDSLHGCQAITTAGPPPAGLRCLQAALYA